MTRTYLTVAATALTALAALAGCQAAPSAEVAPSEAAAEYSNLGACPVEVVAAMLYGGIPESAVTPMDADPSAALASEDIRCTGNYLIDLTQVEEVTNPPIPEITIEIALVGGGQARLDELSPKLQELGYTEVSKSAGTGTWNMDGVYDTIAYLAEDGEFPSKFGETGDLIAIYDRPILSAFE